MTNTHATPWHMNCSGTSCRVAHGQGSMIREAAVEGEGGAGQAVALRDVSTLAHELQLRCGGWGSGKSKISGARGPVDCRCWKTDMLQLFSPPPAPTSGQE